MIGLGHDTLGVGYDRLRLCYVRYRLSVCAGDYNIILFN